MAEIGRTALKAYFETGDVPTEAQFIDLIDSLFDFTDDGTPVLITTNQTVAGEKTLSDNLKVNAQASGGSHTYSFSTTPIFDFDDGNSLKMTATANITSLTLDNKVNGGSYLIFLKQDATGGRTIPAPDSTFGNITNNSAPFVTAANAVNIINVNVDDDGDTYTTVETYTP